MFRLTSVKKQACLWLVLLFIIILVSGCGTEQGPTEAENDIKETRTFVDDAGRTVTVPVEINKTFSTSPVGSIMVYTLAPDKLVGWNFEFLPADAEYLLPQYRTLPNLGGWYAKSTCNVEELLKIHPDVLLSMGVINDTALSQAEEIQEQTGIPVVLIDTGIKNLDKAYAKLGDLLGEEARAEELAAYCHRAVNEIAGTAAQIPAEKRVTVYYAEGPKGLQTDPKGSQHTEVLDLVGGINVADVVMKGGMGMTDVSLEQVLAWNPDVILSRSAEQGGAINAILTDSKWQQIEAVKNNRVYLIPDSPFCWFDRPPSANRIIGVQWLANLLYPETFDLDMKTEIKEFYSLFYHLDLSDQQVETLLKHSPDAARS